MDGAANPIAAGRRWTRLAYMSDAVAAAGKGARRPITYRRVDARGPGMWESSRYGEGDERRRVQKRWETR